MNALCGQLQLTEDRTRQGVQHIPTSRHTMVVDADAEIVKKAQNGARKAKVSVTPVNFVIGENGMFVLPVLRNSNPDVLLVQSAEKG